MDTATPVSPKLYDGLLSYEPNCLYLVCKEQWCNDVGNLMFVDASGIDRCDGDVWGIHGTVYSDAHGEYGCFGVTTCDVIMNYTQYMRMRWAATKIQRTFRRHR